MATDGINGHGRERQTGKADGEGRRFFSLAICQRKPGENVWSVFNVCLIVCG
jgi:hypothetical protein